LAGIENRDKKYVGRLERVLFIRVTLPPLDRYIRFQLANHLSILPTIPSHMDLALKEGPNERPRYYNGKEETPQSKIPAKPSTLSTQPTGTKKDLARLIFKPETASKHKNNTRRYRRWSAFAPQKTKVSSTNNIWEMSTVSELLELIEKPDRRPMWIKALINLLRASITMTNKRGNRGSRCLIPWELLKKPDRVPFTKTEKCIEVMQCAIQEHHFSPKPHLLNIYNKKSQLIWSYAFSISSLQINLGSPDLIQLSKHSLAIRTESRICLPFTKAFWEFEITFSITLLILFARALAMIL